MKSAIKLNLMRFFFWWKELFRRDSVWYKVIDTFIFYFSRNSIEKIARNENVGQFLFRFVKKEK